MESFGAGPLAAIASASKIIYWSFIVTDTAGPTTTYWSTGTIPDTGSGWEEGHSFKIINFSGVTLRRNKSESGIHAANDVTFTIVNGSNTLTASNFVGGTVQINLIIDDGGGKELCGTWGFSIKSASSYNQQIDVVCVDFLQQYLKGTYPPTRLVDDIFPSVQGKNDNVCVPHIYGQVYIPLRSIYVDGDRYYMLGPTTDTYFFWGVRSPRVLGAKIEWDVGGGNTFPQSTKTAPDATEWRVFQALIDDGNPGVFVYGDKILDVPSRFYKTSGQGFNLSWPNQVIKDILNYMGVVDGDIDTTSFSDAYTNYYSPWGLFWTFGLWNHEDREKVLARLLTNCHSCLVVGEKLKLQVLSETSQKTITDAEVLRGDDNIPIFLQTDSLAENISDSGYILSSPWAESQDQLVKNLVPVKSTTNNPDKEAVDLSCVYYITNTVPLQKLGILHFQRKFLKKGEVSFTAKGTCLALRPDDMITINYADFGGNYDALIDEMTINPDVSIGIKAITFSDTLDSWGDLSPGAITYTDDYPGTVTSVAGQDSGSVIPVGGTFTLGWIRWNNNPEAGGNVGWVCTVAGTPGTWKAFGIIGA